VLLHILVERKVTLICSHPVFNLSRLSIAHARVSIWRRQQDKCRANHRGGLISWACRGALLVPRSLPYDFRAPVSRLSGVVGLVSCLHANSSLGVKRAYSGRKSASSSNAPLSSRDLAKTASTVLVSARRTFASHYCCCERLFACLDRPTLASLQLGTSLSQDLKDMDRCTVEHLGTSVTPHLQHLRLPLLQQVGTWYRIDCVSNTAISCESCFRLSNSCMCVSAF